MVCVYVCASHSVCVSVAYPHSSVKSIRPEPLCSGPPQRSQGPPSIIPPQNEGLLPGRAQRHAPLTGRGRRRLHLCYWSPEFTLMCVSVSQAGE